MPYLNTAYWCFCLLIIFPLIPNPKMGEIKSAAKIAAKTNSFLSPPLPPPFNLKGSWCQSSPAPTSLTTTTRSSKTSSKASDSPRSSSDRSCAPPNSASQFVPPTSARRIKNGQLLTTRQVIVKFGYIRLSRNWLSTLAFPQVRMRRMRKVGTYLFRSKFGTLRLVSIPSNKPLLTYCLTWYVIEDIQKTRLDVFQSV